MLRKYFDLVRLLLGQHTVTVGEMDGRVVAVIIMSLDVE